MRHALESKSLSERIAQLDLYQKKKTALPGAASPTFAIAPKRLRIGPGMNQAPNAIRKQHIDLARLD
jgi:hypothetical protein